MLKGAVENFSGFVVFQPIINGVGGNLVTVQASRISTKLYQTAELGDLPPGGRIFEWPWRVLFHGTPYAKSACILIILSVPGQVIFIFLADFIHQSTITIGFFFVVSYMAITLVQIMILLLIAHTIIHAFWRFKIDPDTASIPYLTSISDLLGSSLLLGAFYFLRFIGHEYESLSYIENIFK